MRSSGSSAFTVARVPTGMNAGVSTAPCGVEKTPARAAPAVNSMRKEKLTLYKDSKTNLTATKVLHCRVRAPCQRHPRILLRRQTYDCRVCDVPAGSIDPT